VKPEEKIQIIMFTIKVIGIDAAPTRAVLIEED
jgi:kynurenine formamidase